MIYLNIYFGIVIKRFFANLTPNPWCLNLWIVVEFCGCSMIHVHNNQSTFNNKLTFQLLELGKITNKQVLPNFYIWLSMCDQRHKKSIQTYIYVLIFGLLLKNYHIDMWTNICYQFDLKPSYINATNFAIPWFIYIKSYIRVKIHLWIICAQFDVFVPKPFYIQCDPFWTSFIYI